MVQASDLIILSLANEALYSSDTGSLFDFDLEGGQPLPEIYFLDPIANLGFLHFYDVLLLYSSLYGDV